MLLNQKIVIIKNKQNITCLLFLILKVSCNKTAIFWYTKISSVMLLETCMLIVLVD